MTLEFSSPNREKKPKNTWKIFLLLVIFLLSIISVYFLFRHFKNKPQKGAEKLLTNESQAIKNSSSKDKNLRQNFNYQPIWPTGKEPEYKGIKLPISSVGTEYKKRVTEKSFFSKETQGKKFGGTCFDCGAKGKVKNVIHVQCGKCKERIEGDGKLRCGRCNKQKFSHNCDQQRESLTMLPCGSAVLTSSGDLEKQGIKAIIHACPSSIKENKDFQPNIQGIIRSVQNSILLAERNNYKSIAFCLVGSNFLDNIIPPSQVTKKEKRVKLAEIIIRAAIEQKKSLERIVFVDFGNSAFQRALLLIIKEKGFTYGEKGKVIAVAESYSIGGGKEKKGITDYSLHECEVIINSLNAEGEFVNSRSLSGFIASQTGSGKNRIQKEIKKCIFQFNKRL